MNDEILQQSDRVIDFLLSCGGPYKSITGELQMTIDFAIGSDQYLMKEQGDEIEYFVGYWKIHPQDIANVQERIKPLCISTGNTIYITEFGNKGGRSAITDILQRLREKEPQMAGLLWHRPERANKFHHFPKQKGKGV